MILWLSTALARLDVNHVVDYDHLRVWEPRGAERSVWTQQPVSNRNAFIGGWIDDFDQARKRSLRLPAAGIHVRRVLVHCLRPIIPHGELAAENSHEIGFVEEPP